MSRRAASRPVVRRSRESSLDSPKLLPGSNDSTQSVYERSQMVKNAYRRHLANDVPSGGLDPIRTRVEGTFSWLLKIISLQHVVPLNNQSNKVT